MPAAPGTTSTRLTPLRAGSAGAAILGLAVTLITSFEGDGGRVGYRDPVGIATACYGHTGAGTVVGKHYTQAQCTAFLQADESRTYDSVLACTAVPLPGHAAAAFISFAYNVGPRPYCVNVAPLVNSGRLKSACNKLPLYHFAGGRSLPGLVRRRAAEQALCLEDVK